MRIRQLPKEWANTARPETPVMSVSLELPLEHAARLMALQEMYPGRTREQILLDLLGAALDDLEEALPYTQGERIVAEDELGDPIYQDVGLTPRFLELTRRFRNELRGK